MDADDMAAPHARAQDTASKWNFHTLVVASGASTIETTSRMELLASLAGDARLTIPSRYRNSYRIVRRPEVEEAVGILHLEAVQAEREAAAVSDVQTSGSEKSEQPTVASTSSPSIRAGSHALGGEVDVGVVPLTPSAMALAFQRLVALDKQAWAETVATEGGGNTSPPLPCLGGNATRIFLLVDYPSTVAEVQALLFTPEAGQTTPHQSAPGVPQLPLLDGVLLLVDPALELRERRKSLSQTDERRKSHTKRISAEGREILELADKQPAVDSIFQTANAFVRSLYETAAVGGLEWSDFEFVDLPCCSPTNDVTPAIDLIRDLEKTLATRVAQKAAFKDWVSSFTTVALPTMDGASVVTQAATAQYEQLLHPVFEPSVSVACIIWAMREAVVRSSGECGDNSTGAVSNNVSVPEAFIDHGDDAALGLALSYDLFTNERVRLDLPCDPCCVGDGERIDAVEKAIWTSCDLPGVGNQGRKAMPVCPRLSDAERSVLDTEFASFVAIPLPRVHLMRQLLRVEELLGQPWKGKLQTRDVVESLHKEILPQRLAAILRDNPTVVKDYDEPTDSLLVAAIVTTAPGRFRTTAWTARDHVRHRPALKDWHRDTLPSDEYLTPRTALAATACVPLSAGQLSGVAEKCSIAYPADQSIIKLYQSPHAPAWLSVSLDGDVFGLRPRPSSSASDSPPRKRFAMRFYANLADRSQVLIREGRELPRKPDRHASVSMSLTTPDGLTVTACSDGAIVQQRHRAIASEKRVVDETFRVISGKGTVVCVLSDESRHVLLPNGDVVMSQTGRDVVTEPLENANQRQITVDPETNAVVDTRPLTGVVVVTHTDGSRVTYHADGTTMYSTPTRSHVLITKASLADVCIDVDVNLTAQRHSNGEKVAVTKGGLRARSIIRPTDGTEIQIQYNTKVVAEVNGRIVMDKPDGTKIVAKDSGRVEFTPRRMATAPRTPLQSESDEDADRDELSHNRLYYFNCRDGSLDLVDHEQNHFCVDVGDGNNITSFKVDLAGVLSGSDADKYQVEPIPARAVINDPIEPFVFVLHGDGTGRELLRPRDVRDFFATDTQVAVAVSEVSHHTTPPPPPPLSAAGSGGDWWTKASLWAVERVFVQQLRPDPRLAVTTKRKWFADEKLTSCFERLKTPVATAYCLVTEACLPPLSVPKKQITVVRHLEQLRPMASDNVVDMLSTLDKWRQWQTAREANKDRFKVVDPRDTEALALELAMQRKVVAAYKATRARKKAERQKQRELQRKTRVENTAGNHVHMETVQEGNEPQDGDHGDGDELDQMFSEGTDDEDSHSDMDVEVDDPDELMWTAFSHADAGDSGRLTLAQARHALVQVLGVGVTLVELASQLRAYKQLEPFSVSFDVFVDLVHALRGEQDPPGDSPAGGRDGGNNHSPMDSMPPAYGKQLAVGSATEAVRSFSLLRLNPSSPL